MANPRTGWYGVDLDGTLVEYEHGNWQGPTHVGKPIPKMVERVKRWLSEGKRVKIMTARVSNNERGEATLAEAAIKEWCLEHLGQELEVTCIKDYQMIALFDDRAVGVIPNTGILIGVRDSEF